jgi:Xaa-Pro aminopeptidase
MDGGAGELRDGLARLGCAALLVAARSARDPDLAPFVGPVHLGQSFLIATPDGPPRLGFLTPMEREEAAATGLPLLEPGALEVHRLLDEGLPAAPFLAEVLARGLALAGLRPPARLALAGHGPAGVLHEACARLGERGWTFAAGNGLVLGLRKRKNDWELGEVKRTAAGTAAAFRAVAGRLAQAAERGGELWFGGERLTAGRLRGEVARVLAGWGLEQPEGNIVAAGRDAGVPHSTGEDERVLRPGEALVVDLFPRGRLFADCTRTFCAGEPPEGLRAAHAAVRAALESAKAAARPGVRGWDLQEAACRAFESAGWSTLVSSPETTVGYVHGLGHGVGYELHEQPSFRKAAGPEGVLAEGDVLTLEPGLYDPSAGWGVRLEDLVTLGPGGALELLTPQPYDLDPRAWGE